MLPILLFNKIILDEVSLGSNQTSDVVDVSETVNFTLQAVWSSGSTPVGTLSFQASLDGTNFTEISNSAVSGSSGSVLFNAQNCGYVYFRCVYTRSSGSATLTVKISAKRK